jgi:hypothetical protein
MQVIRALPFLRARRAVRQRASSSLAGVLIAAWTLPKLEELMRTFSCIALSAFVSVALVIALGLAPGVAAPEIQRHETTIWEYQCLSLPDGNAKGIEQAWVPELNTAGADGWEVVATVPLTVRGDTASLRVLLKRVKKPPEPAGRLDPASAKSAGGDGASAARTPAERLFDLADKDGNHEISEDEFNRAILLRIRFKEFAITPKFPIVREEFLKTFPNPAGK